VWLLIGLVIAALLGLLGVLGALSAATPSGHSGPGARPSAPAYPSQPNTPNRSTDPAEPAAGRPGLSALSINLTGPDPCQTATCQIDVAVTNGSQERLSGVLRVTMNGELVKYQAVTFEPGSVRNIPASAPNPTLGPGNSGGTMHWRAEITRY